MGKRTQTRERQETDFSCKRLPEVGDSGVGGIELVEGILFSKKKNPPFLVAWDLAFGPDG